MSDTDDSNVVPGYDGSLPPLREYCAGCCCVTPSNVKEYASGTEFLCAICGRQVDFLHDEEDD